MIQVARHTKTQLDSEFCSTDKNGEVAIESAVRDMGRMGEAERWHLEGKG